jgi:hypothetical protein
MQKMSKELSSIIDHITRSVHAHVSNAIERGAGALIDWCWHVKHLLSCEWWEDLEEVQDAHGRDGLQKQHISGKLSQKVSDYVDFYLRD